MSNLVPTPGENGAGSGLAPREPDALQSYEEQYPLDGLEQGGGASLRRLTSALLRYKWLVLLITLLGSAAGVLAVRFVSMEYEAQATIWIEAPSGRNTGGTQQTLGQPLQAAALLGQQAWLQLLESYAVLGPVVMERKLYLRTAVRADSILFRSFSVQPDVRGGQYRLVVGPDGAGYRLETHSGELLERGAAGDSIGADLGFLWQLSAASLRPGQQVEFSVRQPREAASALAGDLEPRLDANHQFLRVELAGPDPVKVAGTVNSVVDRFVQLTMELKTEKLAELESILGQQLAQAGDYLQEAEMGLQEFRVRTITLPSDIATPAPGLEETQSTVLENFFDTKHELEELGRDRQAIERVLNQVRGGVEVPVLSLELIPSVTASSEIKQVLAQLTELRVEARTLGQRYTDQHPSVRTINEQIAHLERETVPVLLEKVIQQLGAREAELNDVVESASAELRDIPPRISEEARLERHVETSTDLYTNLRRSYEQARLAAATAIPDMRVLDRAAEPTRPVSDKRRQLLAMLVLGSLGFALVGAILLDRIDPRLQYPEQVSELGLVTLGAIPHVKRGKAALMDLPSDPQLVEAFRAIRLNLEYAHGKAGPTMLTVSSPGPGDGKSFVSLNLAMAFARNGQRTLLIDGDLRRGALHDVLGQPRVPGLTNYLLGDASWLEIVRSTQHPRISLVPAGTRRANAPELLGTPAMGEVLSSALRSGFTAIVIDSPPLAAAVDPYILATLTRNLVVVLRAANTNREMAGLKLELVNRLPIRVLGAILNDTPRGGMYRYYAYEPAYEAVDEILVAATREPQLTP